VTYANVVATMALLAALGGGALAATSFVGSDGRIHGCVGKKKGRLRLVRGGKSCKHGKRGEFAITWNQRGRSGPTGPAGATGPSDAYFAADDTAAANEKSISVSVPAGRYVVHGSAQGNNGLSSEQDVDCLLTRQDTHATLDEKEVMLAPNASAAYRAEVSTLAAVTLPAASRFTLDCSSASAVVIRPRLVAEKVGALH
jgi:hypothetical protein